MKKLLFLIFVIFLFSCEKEEYNCYKCDTMAKGFTSSVIINCGVTEDEMRQFRSALWLQATAMTDSIVIVFCKKVECLNPEEYE
jgi:hypothetical protein